MVIEVHELVRYVLVATEEHKAVLLLVVVVAERECHHVVSDD